MKMSKILSLVLVLVMLLSCFVACKPNGNQGNQGDQGNNGPKKEVVKVWVSEKEGAKALAEEQIAEFLAANPDYDAKYTFEVSGVSEADAASQVLADVALAPDIYCFAQDQLARLVQADALAIPGQQATANVKAANDAISISAASVAGTLYAYPLTSDNGYYMYYDTSVITNPDDLAQIVADCEAADKYVCFELENAWYTASFFMATGCVNNWTMNENGKFTAVEDTYNSAAGLVAMKGMQIVTKSEKYVNTSSEFENAGIVITGIWNANTAEEAFGENFGVTDLPSFTVDGESYHLASFSGNKLMGVKPQADSQKLSMLHKLAQYLTNTECQLERYNEFQWGPSNLEAQNDAGVKANASLAALALQNQYAIPQGNIHGSWWDIAKLLGGESKNANSDEDLQLALDTYTETINGLFKMTDEELRAWSVIGSINGTGWNVDLEMEELSKNVWQTLKAYDITTDDQFKLRQGKAWNVQVGVANEKTGETASGYYARLMDGADEPGNIVVETAGKYFIKLTWEEGTHNATVELVPAN